MFCICCGPGIYNRKTPSGSQPDLRRKLLDHREKGFGITDGIIHGIMRVFGLSQMLKVLRGVSDQALVE